MLALRRHVPVLAAVLALALVAGPAASAACGHAGSGRTMAEHGPASAGDAHTRPAHGVTAPAAEAPCHGEAPESTPPVEDARDCVTLCCAAETSTPVPPAPTPSASGVAVPADAARTVPAPAPPVDRVAPEASPPREGPRLYVTLGQFLI